MESFLVATHLSSLNSSSTTSIPIQTTRQNLPLPPASKESDTSAEHAIYTSIFNTPATGTILLRLIHGGLIIELVSLSNPVPPMRLVFPALILPSPAVFLWDTTGLHILAVTDAGSLHRVVIPINGRNLWQDQLENVWHREYTLRNFPGNAEGCFAHAQGTHCVAVSMPNGSLLRLEVDFVGHDGHEEEWTETLFQQNSFLSSLTAFLPALHSSYPNGADIISIATHPWPTDIGHVWTLSRDRTLRLWKAKLGCVASRTLAFPSQRKDATPASGSSSSNVKHHSVLSGNYQTLLRVFSVTSETIYVLVFIPTILSPSSGGSFCIVDTSADHFQEVCNLECSARTAHCHLQDFLVSGNTLYTLWDRQGRSAVERININIQELKGTNYTPSWRTSCYVREAEFTPAYMEEQLLSCGSLTEKYLAVIMKPGMFSSLTLRTAIEQYMDACLSLPGPPSPQLLTTYPTICENIAAVVGCTVTLNRDPQTGTLQHANYWTALKRDWEGFIARCREVERSARWPLALGIQGFDEIIIVERERAGCLVGEDLPIHLQRLIIQETTPDPQYSLLAVLWALRARLGPQMMSSLENRCAEIMHQEIAFSFADILQDQTRQINIKDNLDEGSASWFLGRFQSVGNIDNAIRVALDAIGDFDLAVKREVDESSLLLPSSLSEWSRGLAAAYISTTMEARYDLCLSLITLLFFLSDELIDWDGSLLAEVFAIFRGVAILRYVSGQPAESVNGDHSDSSSPDDVIARMRNMNVSQQKAPFASKSSLPHLLLAHSADPNGVPAAAHTFLDATGLLQSMSPAHVTKCEVMFCERLRAVGFLEVTRECLSWLPRTPAAIFILARVWLQMGRVDDASQLFEKIAGTFGPGITTTHEDFEALSSVLPAASTTQSEFSFYLHVSNLFKSDLLVQHEVHFARLAISTAPSNADTSFLWNNVIKGLLDLGSYEDAYASIMATPYEKQKRECASQLAIRMCEENAVERLMTFDFGGISDEVASALSFKARNVEPHFRICYAKILYTWYVRRGDFRNAALTMYQRAQKLKDVVFDSPFFLAAANEQLDAYSIAINALSLVDDTAWILTPVVHDSSPSKKRVSKHIPESKYISSKYDAEIVHLADIQREYAILRAQVDIIKREPSVIASPDFLISPTLIVMRLAHANLYTQAMATARSLKIDMTDLFSHLTNQCVRLTREPNLVMQQDTSDWLLTDKVSTWANTPADRGWRYLRQSLERHDNAETDWRYAKSTLETILSLDRTLPPPPWLIQMLENRHQEYLIRVSLRYENVDDAVMHALALLRKSDAALQQDSSLQNSSSTWFPYALIDQVLTAAAAQDAPPPHLPLLRTEITSRIKRLQKSIQTVSH